MYLPMISGYELGQFLRILLWIFIPIAILSMLVTTWLHYRRRRRGADHLVLSIEGLGPDGQDLILSRHAQGSGDAPAPAAPMDDDAYKETVYKGIIWMKEKYEQYRDLADQRYERLKEELARAEKRYEDLMASIVEVKVGDRTEKPLSGSAHALLERDARGQIQELEEQLHAARQEIEELVGKLRNNSQLLLTIYQELDRTLRTTDKGTQV